MERIRCFLLEETYQVAVYLRRYTTTYQERTCPVHDEYHTASVHLHDEDVERDAQGYITNGEKSAPPHDDSHWPKICACGYVFREEDEWQRDAHLIYQRADTGEKLLLRNAPPGAMWYAWWFDDLYQPQLKHCLVIRMPGGGEWVIDGQASNCTMPEDKGQEKHHCWILHGTPPDVTVDKNGITCNAGAGSVTHKGWHGFLRNGFLER